jgi:phosphate:Na+ symporter
MMNTSELSLLQAKKEIVVFAQQTRKLFCRLQNMLTEKKDRQFAKQFDKVDLGEGKSDEMEEAIAHYLAKVSEHQLSKSSSKRVGSMLKIVDEMESMGDSCLRIARSLERTRTKSEKLSATMKENIGQMFGYIVEAFDVMIANLEEHHYKVTLSHAQKLELRINNFRNELRKSHLKDIESESYSYKTGALYKDIFTEAEKLADNIYEVTVSIIDSAE